MWLRFLCRICVSIVHGFPSRAFLKQRLATQAPARKPYRRSSIRQQPRIYRGPAVDVFLSKSSRGHIIPVSGPDPARRPCLAPHGLEWSQVRGKHCWLHPQQSGPDTQQGPSGVINRRPGNFWSWCGTGRTIRSCWDSEVFRVSGGCSPSEPPGRKCWSGGWSDFSLNIRFWITSAGFADNLKK